MSLPPSDSQKREAAAWLLKPLALEAKQGCRDTAVSGGLERWLPRVREKLVAAGWEPGEAGRLLEPLAGYGADDPAGRERRLHEVQVRLQADTARRKPAPVPPSAPAPRPDAPVPAPQAIRARKRPAPADAKPAPRPAGPVTLETPAQFLAGVGPARGRLLKKLGIETAGDLVRYYPRDWQDRRRLIRIADLRPGEPALVAGRVRLRTTLFLRRGLKLTKVVIDDGTGLLTGTWFNQPFMKDRFEDGRQVLFFGTVESARGLQIANPDFEVLDDPEEETVHTGRIVPIYPVTEGLSQRVLRGILFRFLSEWSGPAPEILPAGVSAAHAFPPAARALRSVHFPERFEDLAASRARLIFEELFLQQIAMLRFKRRHAEGAGLALTVNGPRLARFDASLPFRLTAAQERARGDLLGDLALARPMHRLLQGDVGSGKTLVAAFGLLAAADSGAQSALMAPTEILAIQHYLTLQRLLEPCGVTLGLFTSGVAARERKSLHRRLAAGEIEIAIGTHALTQEGIEFKSLALAVVDEQHRFGVEQRSLLRAKGAQPHVLVMTATPIPRTLALTAFGDLEVSTLDELPPGRQPVTTEWLRPPQARAAYQRAAEMMKSGRQAYVIFPLVEESEKSDLKAVTREYRRLAEDVFPGFRLGLMHGQLPTPEKESVMAAFKAGELDGLVATSVVEVGVDVPNAAVMIIENAERFGLAQLHQLRGRIGRGTEASTCYLIGDPKTEEGMERITLMTRYQDGFKLAEKDLELRGPGEFFGLKQHGLPDLKLADLIRDAPVIELAREAAAGTLAADPDLQAPACRDLRSLYERVYGTREKRLLAG